MKSSSRHRENSLRIIAGEWRGRVLAFPDIQGLRPTPDRVRETLFNWLQPVIQGSKCLDLFAGSGALGVEALSRGAATVTLVEADPCAFQALQRTIDQLNAGTRACLRHSDAFDFLDSQPAGPFDIVFVDPPYGKGWVRESLVRLSLPGLLSRQGRVYIEYESSLTREAVINDDWQVLKHKKAGQVTYALLQPKDEY